MLALVLNAWSPIPKWLRADLSTVTPADIANAEQSLASNLDFWHVDYGPCPPDVILLAAYAARAMRTKTSLRRPLAEVLAATERAAGTLCKDVADLQSALFPSRAYVLRRGWRLCVIDPTRPLRHVLTSAL